MRDGEGGEQQPGAQHPSTAAQLDVRCAALQNSALIVLRRFAQAQAAMPPSCVCITALAHSKWAHRWLALTRSGIVTGRLTAASVPPLLCLVPTAGQGLHLWRQVRQWLNQLQDCITTYGDEPWPHYTRGLTELNAPYWAKG